MFIPEIELNLAYLVYTPGELRVIMTQPARLDASRLKASTSAHHRARRM